MMRVVGLAAVATGFLLAPTAGWTQGVFPATGDDSVAVAVAAFRTAIVHGQLTAHGASVPAVLCLARVVRHDLPVTSSDRFTDPDSSVLGATRAWASAARAMSACRVESFRGVHDDTSMVVERSTGQRGLVIYMEPAVRHNNGEVVVPIGYFEHGYSWADWVCAVRRIDDRWVVNACRMIRGS